MGHRSDFSGEESGKFFERSLDRKLTGQLVGQINRSYLARGCDSRSTARLQKVAFQNSEAVTTPFTNCRKRVVAWILV
jgi:hypothetical protein